MTAWSHKQAVFENLEATWRVMGKNHPLVEEDGTIRYVSEIPFALLNGLFCPGFQRAPLKRADQRFFEERGLPYCCWLDSTVDGRPLLEAGGVDPGAYTGVALDSFGIDLEIPAKITVQEVTTPELFAEWGKVLQEGYGWPLEVSKPFIALNAPYGPGTSFTHYLGYLDGRAVGTLSIIRSGDVGGLWNGIVRPEARHQGVATAMGLAALRRIDEEGCSTAVALLMAEKKASRLCEKLGFQEVCHITPYVYGMQAGELEPDA